MSFTSLPQLLECDGFWLGNFRTHRCISLGSTGLCTFTFLRWSQTWPSPALGGSSFYQSLPLSSATWVMWLQHLLVKVEAKKSLRTSASSTIQVTRSPISFRRGSTFSLVFLLSPRYLQKVVSLPLMSLDKFNSIRAVAFLTWSLTAWTISLFLPGYLFLLLSLYRLPFYSIYPPSPSSILINRSGQKWRFIHMKGTSWLSQESLHC